MFGIYSSLLNSSRRGRFYQLTCEGAAFDLIYVDGDHARDQVTIDSLLAWRCLHPGGIMIWDDNEAYLPDAAPLISAFIAMQQSASSRARGSSRS
jgi:predicted O-methyltransferase YrrM